MLRRMRKNKTALILLVVFLVAFVAQAWHGGVQPNPTCNGWSLSHDDTYSPGTAIWSYSGDAPSGSWSDDKTSASGTATVTWTDSSETYSYPWSTSKPGNCSEPTKSPTPVVTETVTPDQTEEPTETCEGDCQTPTISPTPSATITKTSTVTATVTDVPVGGGQCATSNFKFDVGESLIAHWVSDGHQLNGSVFATAKGELIIYFANGERNSGKLKVENTDGSKVQFVDVGASGCDSKPESNVTPTVTSTPTAVPFSAVRAAIKLNVDCEGKVVLDINGMDYVRAEYTDATGTHVFTMADGKGSIPLNNDITQVTVWVKGQEGIFPVTIPVSFEGCVRPKAEIKVVVISTPAPTPNPFSEDRAAITLNVGTAGLSKDPGIVFYSNGQAFESMWLVTSNYRVQLNTWKNDLTACKGLILANFEYSPADGETAEIQAVMTGHYVVHTAVQTAGNGSDVNCSNLMKSGDAWLGHWYGGNTYQSWRSFLGYTGTIEQFIALMEKARGSYHAEVFELPKAIIDNSGIFG